MRGVVEAAAEGDLGDRSMRLGRRWRDRPATLQPALPQIMREIIAGALKQILKIALRNAFDLRDACRRDVGIAELAFDAS